jgi:putative cell wall-binding protein
MRRSRTSRLVRRSVILASVLVSLAFATPALAAPPSATENASWSPKLAYVLTTGSVRAALSERLHLSAEQSARLRQVGWDLFGAQNAIQKRSDLIAGSGGLTTTEKKALIASSGYNRQLESTEDSGVARAAAAAGVSADTLTSAVDAVWQRDAAEHRLESALTDMKATAASAAGVGSFHVYGTWFTADAGLDPFHVALPDKYLKYANNGYPNSGSTARPSGYPSATYAVSLYWNGVHYGLKTPNSAGTVYTSPHSIAYVKVLDVGPWNVDDDWWNSYTDPVRPRRIGTKLPSGVSRLALGMPESQAAYFDHYNRPSKIPAASHSPENYWQSPGAADGQWSGADQFGRQVLNPAGIDLTTAAARTLGLSDNEWIDVVPLWEARLDLVGGVKVTDPNGKTATGPYLTGQRLTFAYTVKNLGSLAGTWDDFTMTLRTAGGAYHNPPYQGPVTLSPGATRTFSFTYTLDATGTLTCFAQAQRAGLWSHVGTASVSLPSVGVRTVDRVGGATRFDTAVAISHQAYPSTAKAVVLATGLDFPDALAGAALARAVDGPLLLVSTALPAPVEGELKRLKPAKVIILGGESVVSTAVASRIASATGLVPTRIAGHNRYATARLIAQAIVATTGGKTPGGTAIVATGRDFPDALSASVLSAAKHWPIILTEPNSVPTDTAAALASIGATNTIVVGGTSAVSAQVAGTFPKPTRVAGSTRYDTSAAIADLAESKTLTFGYVSLAAGTSFPDALAGGVLAARGWGTMLLTPPDSLATPMRYRLQRHRTVTTHLQALGSTSALSDAALWQGTDALR